MVTSCGASSSNSAVARWTASSVRIGSTGNGRPTRASTARSTSTVKQRRLNVRRARTAACSCAAVNRPVARARTIARAASAKVRADVTCRAPTGSASIAVVSCSSRAATSALDSMYRTLVTAVRTGRAVAPGFRGDRRRAVLRFATVAVDQFGGGATGQPDVGPILERVAGFNGRMENARRNQLVPAASARASRSSSRRHQFGNHAAVGRDRNSLASLDAPDVTAQIVLQLADASFHSPYNIATCGHTCKVCTSDLDRRGNGGRELLPSCHNIATTAAESRGSEGIRADDLKPRNSLGGVKFSPEVHAINHLQSGDRRVRIPASPPVIFQNP